MWLEWGLAVLKSAFTHFVGMPYAPSDRGLGKHSSHIRRLFFSTFSVLEAIIITRIQNFFNAGISWYYTEIQTVQTAISNFKKLKLWFNHCGFLKYPHVRSFTTYEEIPFRLRQLHTEGQSKSAKMSILSKCVHGYGDRNTNVEYSTAKQGMICPSGEFWPFRTRWPQNWPQNE